MKPYIAKKLPFNEEINYNEITKQLLKTNASVSKFDGMLGETSINKELFLNPLTKKEAVLSSKIEGTQATLTEFLEIEVEDGKNSTQSKYDDFIEISNYNKAIAYAEDELNEKNRITLWMIRNIHKILLTGARGKDKNPGEFRNDQNWIGKPGSPIEEAIFIPVAPEHLMESLENLEEYISNYDEQSALVQAAIIHVQFEKIHPFKDGNGRIGRMLIPLFLYYKGLISRPVIYISEYLEENRDEYYDKLNSVEGDLGWKDWILFFLKAVEAQADKNIGKIRELQKLYEEYKVIIGEILNTKNSIYILDSLFQHPICKSSTIYESVSSKTDIDSSTIDRYIKKLVENGILIPEQDKDRHKKYYFKKLIDIIQ
ncbi:MAG: Fic family protein [Bacilli bacterium]|nr:Fic family protein [Bacilli bacterium]